MALIDPVLVAKEAIAEMVGNTVAPDIMYTGFSKEFQQVGDTVTVRIPTVSEAREFTQGVAATADALDESSVSVRLDHFAYKDVPITSREMSLSMPEFRIQVINPSINAIVKKIETDILLAGLKASFGVSATGATTDFTNSSKILSLNKVPMNDRFALIDPILLASYQELATFNSFQNSNADTQKTGILGYKFGFETLMSQYLPSYTTSASGTVAAVGTTSVGSQTLSVSGVTNSFVPGDSIKVGSYFYEIDSATAIVGTSQVLTLGLKTQAAITPGTSVTVVGPHRVNLFGHKNWAALVSAPLAPYLDGDNSYVENYKGMSIRISFSRDHSLKRNIVSFDTLYGIKILDAKKIVKGMAF
jgi:coat protein Gp5